MHYLLGNQVDPALLKIEPNFGDLLGEISRKNFEGDNPPILTQT